MLLPTSKIPISTLSEFQKEKKKDTDICETRNVSPIPHEQQKHFIYYNNLSYKSTSYLTSVFIPYTFGCFEQSLNQLHKPKHVCLWLMWLNYPALGPAHCEPGSKNISWTWWWRQCCQVLPWRPPVRQWFWWWHMPPLWYAYRTPAPGVCQAAW